MIFYENSLLVTALNHFIGLYGLFKTIIPDSKYKNFVFFG